MRIAISCQKTDIVSGASKLSAILASSLKKEGFDVACVSLKSPVMGKSFPEFHEIDRWYTSKFDIPNAIGKGYFNTLYYQHHFLLTNQLKKCEKEFRPDVVINTLAYSGTDVLSKTNAVKIDYIQTWPLDLQVSHEPTFWVRLFNGALCLKDHRLTLSKIHKVVCNSEYSKKMTHSLWGHLVPYKNFSVIYPFVDWKELQHYKSGSRPKRVCYLGRICKEKGIDLVINAFLEADVKESELIIAGAIFDFSPHSDYYFNLKEKLLRLGDNRIKLITNPSDAQIAEIYNSSRCFANFNPLETFGMCVVEAMAAGTPPIVADGGGQRETVINGETGFSIDTTCKNCTGQMAKFMHLLLTDDNVFNRMSRQARSHAAKFDKSVFIKKWIKLLEAL